MSYPLCLVGDIVTLRDFTPGDVEDALAIVGDDRVTHWLSFDSRDRAGAEKMIRAAIAAAQVTPRSEFYLAITPPGSDQVIGFVRLARSGVQAGKLGYAVHADHQGHGYATDAARTLIRYGFTQLGLHRITAAVGPDNAASIAVLKHLGLTPEGRLRDHVFTNGAWRDSLLFSLLEHEQSL
jgi:ribosomal-protein-alanine N-acetyltransferase